MYYIYIYIQIAAYVMNSDHKITQWNTCNHIVLYYLVVLLFNIYSKTSPEGGKVIKSYYKCLPTPILPSIVEVSLRAVKIK